MLMWDSIIPSTYIYSTCMIGDHVLETERVQRAGSSGNFLGVAQRTSDSVPRRTRGSELATCHWQDQSRAKYASRTTVMQELSELSGSQTLSRLLSPKFGRLGGEFTPVKEVISGCHHPPPLLPFIHQSQSKSAISIFFNGLSWLNNRSPVALVPERLCMIARAVDPARDR